MTCYCVYYLPWHESCACIVEVQNLLAARCILTGAKNIKLSFTHDLILLFLNKPLRRCQLHTSSSGIDASSTSLQSCQSRVCRRCAWSCYMGELYPGQHALISFWFYFPLLNFNMLGMYFAISGID